MAEHGYKKVIVVESVDVIAHVPLKRIAVPGIGWADHLGTFNVVPMTIESYQCKGTHRPLRCSIYVLLQRRRKVGAWIDNEQVGGELRVRLRDNEPHRCRISGCAR